MNLRNAILLLLIGAAATLITTLLSYVDMMGVKGFKFEITVFILRLSDAVIAAGFLLWTIGWMRKRDLKATRIASLVIFLGATLQFLSSGWFYVHVYTDYFSFLNKKYIVYALLQLLVPFSLAFSALWLMVPKQKVNRAAWWLIPGGAIFFYIYAFLQLQTAATIGTGNISSGMGHVNYWINVIALIYPVGIALTGMALPRFSGSLPAHDNALSYSATGSPELLDELAVEEQLPVVSGAGENRIRRWLSSFFLSTIPVVGTGFLLYWSISRKYANRGNWATAKLMVSLVSLIILVLWYGNDLDSNVGMSKGMQLLTVLVVMGTIVVLAYTYNARNQESLTREEKAGEMDVEQWLGYLLLLLVPVANLVLLIVCLADKEKPRRREWAIACLIWIPFSAAAIFFFYNAMVNISYYRAEQSFINF